MGDAYVRVVLHESARVGLADEVRAVIPDAVEVVLESPVSHQSKNEARQGLDPVDAFTRFLTERGSTDPNVERLFAELLEEATAEGVVT